MMTSRRGDVILINIHGGFPSSMIAKATRDLKTFRNLVAEAHVYSRVYPTNACADCAFHDMVMDAPLGSMTDSSTYDEWCFSQSTTYSMFNVFKKHGYSTRLFGIFGIDPRLNPQHTDLPYVIDHHKMLVEYGIDEFDIQDGAFDGRPAHLQDQEILMRACEFMTAQSESPRFVMINLAGCRDAKRCEIAPSCDPPIVPTVKLMRGMIVENEQYSSELNQDERSFSSNVLDDPRDVQNDTHGIEALCRCAQLDDYLKGQIHDVDRKTIITATIKLQQFCWECLCKIDQGLDRLLTVLKSSGKYESSAIYLYSDHAIGLYEHCAFNHVPWDACLRTFLIRKISNSHVATCNDTPFSTNNIVPMLYRDCNILANGWRVQRTLGPCCITLGLALSWIARAMIEPACAAVSLRTFFVRALVTRNGRRYAIIMWFSIHDILHATHGEAGQLSDLVRTQRGNCQILCNPAYCSSLNDLSKRAALQVFDHATDPTEMNNICSSEWLKTEAAIEIKETINHELETHGLDHIHMHIPMNVFDRTLEEFKFDPLQQFPTHTPTLVDCACQTLQPTLNDVLVRENCSSMTIHMLQRPLGTEYSLLTLFVLSQTPHHAHVTPPPPLIGAYSSHQLTRLAQLKSIVVDAIKNEKQTLDFCHGHVVLEETAIDLSTERIELHSTGFVVIYTCTPLHDASPCSPSSSLENDRDTSLLHTNTLSPSSINMPPALKAVTEEVKKSSEPVRASKFQNRMIQKGMARTIESKKINGHRFDH